MAGAPANVDYRDYLATRGRFDGLVLQRQHSSALALGGRASRRSSMMSVDEEEEAPSSEEEAAGDDDDDVGALADAALARLQRARERATSNARAVKARTSFNWGADGTVQRYKRTQL